MVNRRWTYIRGPEDLQDELQTMVKYSKKKLEIEKAFTKFISPFIKDKELNILETCCGIGYLANNLSELTPKSKFYCIDQTEEFIGYANKNFINPNIKYDCLDVYDLKNGKDYDISINFASLMVMPYYDQIMKRMIKLTKNHIFIMSLFYDEDIDFEIKVREYKTKAGQKGYNDYLNVYSLPQFIRTMKSYGAKGVYYEPFNINLDLEKKRTNKMGAYTYRLYDKDIIELSGCIKKDWKMIRIDL